MRWPRRRRAAGSVDRFATVRNTTAKWPDHGPTASILTPVVSHTQRRTPGLRERKKLRTRSCLIEAALTLAERQGYEATTVEQIADTAEVSARTFARYFPTKNGVFVSLLNDLTAAADAELERVPAEFAPLRALRTAHTAMLRRNPEDPGVLPAHRLVRLLRLLSNSSELRLLALQLRTRETAKGIARRLDRPVDDRKVRLTAEMWTIVVADALQALARQPSRPADDAATIAEFDRLVLENFDEMIQIAGEMLGEPA